MDNHPIPQDVTGFQFRLIGSMTVKQFAYIAVSTVLVIVTWYLPGLPIFVKAPLLVLFGALGPALAFLPIEGRPMDQMASHFAKALFSPNQYIFHKTGGKLPLSLIELKNVKQQTAEQQAKKKEIQTVTSQKEQKLAQYLQQIHQTNTAMDDKEAAYMQKVLQDPPAASQSAIPAPIASQAPEPVLPPQPVQQPTPIQSEPTIVTQELTQPDGTPSQSPEEKEQKLLQEEQSLKEELAKAQKEEATQHTQQAHEKTAELTKELEEALAQKEILEKELTQLRQNMQVSQPVAIASPTPTQPTQPEVLTATPKQEGASTHIRSIEKSQAPKLGIPTLPDIPNLLMGIVKDPRGNILSNILVEVKDKDGNPVRAFKTNGLGQFAAATALQDGTYTVVFEDPKGQQNFDVVEIEMNGQAVPPIEVISHDAREALRQQLFG